MNLNAIINLALGGGFILILTGLNESSNTKFETAGRAIAGAILFAAGMLTKAIIEKK